MLSTKGGPMLKVLPKTFKIEWSSRFNVTGIEIIIDRWRRLGRECFFQNSSSPLPSLRLPHAAGSCRSQHKNYAGRNKSLALDVCVPHALTGQQEALTLTIHKYVCIIKIHSRGTTYKTIITNSSSFLIVTTKSPCCVFCFSFFFLLVWFDISNLTLKFLILENRKRWKQKVGVVICAFFNFFC